MKVLSLVVVALMVASCLAMDPDMKMDKRETPVDKFDVEKREETKLTEAEVEKMREFRKRLETDPEFKREVEVQLEEKISALPAAERVEAKKRFWGMLGLGLWNPFLFPFWGKRSIETVEPTLTNVDKRTSGAVKRFWGMWGWPYGFGFWGKKRMMETDDSKVSTADRELLEKRDEEFKRFEEAEKRLAPELYTRENKETVTIEEVKEMKKRWWGLGYGYGMGLGYGFGLGYPWGFWGKRDTMPKEQRDAFVDKEMMKANREAAYERLLKDL
jgi:hypothetical protein